MGLKILLFHPTTENPSMQGRLSPPLWPAVISSITPKEHSVGYFQGGLRDINEKNISNYDIVCISSLTTTAIEAYNIGDICKRNNIPCLIGGTHASILPKEAIQHCDSVIIGEVEYIWKKVLQDIEKGCLQSFYKGRLIDPKDFPIADCSIFYKYNKSYALENVIEIMRGCPYNCKFCSATLLSGRKLRYKPVPKILEEIGNWRKKKRAIFASANLIGSTSKAKEIFKAVSDNYNLDWWGDASINVVDDPELLKLMMESGCSYLLIGFESISNETLQSMNKKQNIDRDYKKVVKTLHDHNIDIVGTFIVGWDTHDKSVFKETESLIHDIDIDIPLYIILTPFPGTQIYEEYKKQNRILTEDWSLYTGIDVVFEPKNLTREELIDGYIGLWENTYGHKEVINRVFSRWRGLKREVYDTLLMSYLRGRVNYIKKQYR